MEIPGNEKKAWLCKEKENIFGFNLNDLSKE